MSLTHERANSDSEDEFNWESYLEETSSTAADKRCFYQSINPPANKFEEGMKLEASDPRFPTINCAATVVAKFGPKIRVRMIGASSNDDFWVLVDSRHIHPKGFAESQNMFVSPPFNCQRDGLQWQKFLKNALSGAKFALPDYFIQEPVRPLTNYFRVGNKLEASDPKDSTFVCPATVVEVRGDRIRVEFDGWNMFDWFRYDSRELYPVGWWKKAGVSINPPPKKRRSSSIGRPAKQTTTHAPTALLPNSVPNNMVNLFDTAEEILTPRHPESSLTTVKKLEMPPISSSTPTSSATEQKQQRKDVLTLPKHTARKTLSVGSSLKTTTPPPAVATTVKVAGDKRPSDAHSVNAILFGLAGSSSSTNGDRSTLISNGSSSTASSGIVGGKRKNDDTECHNNNSQDTVNNSLEDVSDEKSFVVYVNSYCSAGKRLDATKLRAAPSQFGPGYITMVMNATLQLLIDCAVSPGFVFHAIPTGSGPSTVSANIDGLPRTRHLPLFRTTFDAWKYLTGVMDKLQTCQHLLSRSMGDCQSCEPAPQPALKKAKAAPQTSPNLSVDGRKRNGSGGSNSSTCTDRETNAHLSIEEVQKWNVDEVYKFVCSVTDSQSADVFRKQEIDGKALLLLTADMMIRYMNVRLGPALKVGHAVDRLKIKEEPERVKVKKETER